MGAASVDHCTYLTDADIEALAGERDRRHLPARDRLLDPPALSGCPPGDRAGVSVAIATNTNPGSSYTTSMSFCIALAVRDLGMTIEEAVRAATLGGATALRRDRHRPPGSRRPRRRGRPRRTLLRPSGLPPRRPARALGAAGR